MCNMLAIIELVSLNMRCFRCLFFVCVAILTHSRLSIGIDFISNRKTTAMKKNQCAQDWKGYLVPRANRCKANYKPNTLNFTSTNRENATDDYSVKSDISTIEMSALIIFPTQFGWNKSSGLFADKAFCVCLSVCLCMYLLFISSLGAMKSIFLLSSQYCFASLHWLFTNYLALAHPIHKYMHGFLCGAAFLFLLL